MATGLDHRIGTELAGYRIEALIGRGQASRVYDACHSESGRHVALKIVFSELSDPGETRDRLLHDLRRLSTLQHEGIVPTYEVGVTEGHLFIAMGHVRGIDLRQLIQLEGPLASEAALELVDQVGGALDTARWATGLVHGNIKPSNILLARSSELARKSIFVSDFCLHDPELVGNGPFGRTPVSSIEYLAPELRSNESATPRADIYALGCMLFECLTGSAPGNGASGSGSSADGRSVSVRKYRPGLSNEIERAVAKATSPNPEHRHATCAEFVADARGELSVSATTHENGLTPSSADPPTPQVPPTFAGPPKQPGNGQAAASEPTPPSRSPRERVNAGLVLGLAVLVVGALWLARGETESFLAEPADDTALNSLQSSSEETGSSTSAQIAPDNAQQAGARPLVPVDGDSVVRIDAESGELVAAVKVPAEPTAVTLTQEGPWVASGELNSLTRIDPATNEAAHTLSLDQTPIALDGRRGLWVMSSSDEGTGSQPRLSVTRVSGDAIVTTIDVATAGSSEARPAFVVDKHVVRVIASSDDESGSLFRVVPLSRRVFEELDQLPTEAVMTLGQGELWIGHHGGNQLIRIETGKTDPLAVIPVGAGLRDVVFDGTSVWAAGCGPSDGYIARIDLELNRVVRQLVMSGCPATLAFGGDFLWIGDERHNNLVRVNTANGQFLGVTDLSARPIDIAASDDEVWVALDQTRWSLSRFTPDPDAVYVPAPGQGP